MRGNPTLSHPQAFLPDKSIEKKYQEKINIDTIFPTRQNLLKKILRKDILTQSIEKNFLIDSLTTNNAMYRDSLALSKSKGLLNTNFAIIFASFFLALNCMNKSSLYCYCHGTNFSDLVYNQLLTFTVINLTAMVGNVIVYTCS